MLRRVEKALWLLAAATKPSILSTDVTQPAIVLSLLARRMYYGAVYIPITIWIAAANMTLRRPALAR
jgi:hypothetical protein